MLFTLHMVTLDVSAETHPKLLEAKSNQKKITSEIT